MRAVHQSKIFEGHEKDRRLSLDTQEAADSLSIIGALRHVSSLEEKASLVQSAADFFVNGRLATALDH
ncbi:hypothetical protein PBY51_014273 [Eleginops maclovinus]|uniref:Uncharacterized protein n=1 Tax=Eleginops maclovinus TaxID=56733 RepID=A0AAN8AC93_ELEMC|nr:hypothetical protein PBY51_014273 [Eleginops maclovinus]